MDNFLQEFIDQYPNFEGCTIQTLDDNKERGDKGLIHILSPNDIDKLASLNSKGAGIFFSVNNMQTGKRSKDSTTKIITWCCDIDNMEKNKQRGLVEQSPIKPSCIVESKHSLHLYWFSLDGTKGKWAEIGSGIQDFFTGDPKVCKDYSTLLRLPGFDHLKNPKEPFTVKLIYIDKSLQYSEEEMVDAFPISRKIEIKASTEKYQQRLYGVRGEISEWNNEDMLKEVSGKNIVNGDTIAFRKNSDGTKQIIVNKKSTSCWIDKNGMIGSYDKGGPTRIQRVLWYNKLSKRQLLEYVKDNFSHRISEEHQQQLNKQNYLTDKGKLIPEEFAKYIKEVHCFECIENGLFKFFPDEGLWKAINDNMAGKIILAEVGDFLEISIGKEEYKAVLLFLKIHAESQILKEKIQDINQYEICINDCIIDTNKRVTRPYTKSDYKISKLPYNFEDILNYEDHKPKRFLQFLEEIHASYEDIDGMIRFWQETIGHFLLPITKRGKMFILQGGGLNGKGKLLSTIRTMLGDNNCCTIELHKLEDVDREKLFGKILAIDSDTSDNIRLDIGPIRKIVDGEVIEARRRYGHPFEFKPMARLIIASNVPPIIKKMDVNMSRRIIYIPFRENFENRIDTELGSKLESERLGIFIWALEGLNRLLKRGSFYIPEEIQKETNQYLNNFSSVNKRSTVDKFIEHIGLRPGKDFIAKREICNQYLQYSEESGSREVLGIQQLSRVLGNKGFNDKDSSKGRGRGIDESKLNMTFTNKKYTKKGYIDSG